MVGSFSSSGGSKNRFSGSKIFSPRPLSGKRFLGQAPSGAPAPQPASDSGVSLPENKRSNFSSRQLSCVFSFASSSCGQEGLRVLNSIGDRGATDELISKRCKKSVSEVRALLNRLHERGIVEYTRKKDLKKGWYKYTWRANYLRALKNLLAEKQACLSDLSRISSDCAMLYRCKSGCERIIPFHEAVDSNFKCGSCDSLLVNFDLERQRSGLQKEISHLEDVMKG